MPGKVTLQYEQMTGPWGSLVRGCGLLSIAPKTHIFVSISGQMNCQKSKSGKKSLYNKPKAGCQLNQVLWIHIRREHLCQPALPFEYVPFSAFKSTSDQRCQNKWSLANLVAGRGVVARKKHVCPLGKSLLNTAVGLSPQPFLYRPTRGNPSPSIPPSLPPPPPDHPWIEGFPSPIVSHPTSLSPQLTCLHPSVIGMCAKSRSTV